VEEERSLDAGCCFHEEQRREKVQVSEYASLLVFAGGCNEGFRV
jgi:hypothetical protein